MKASIALAESKKPSDVKAVSKSLMYNIAIIPASEVSKEKKKQAKVNMYMKLTSSDMISKYKHKLLDKISTRLDKQDLNLGMFSIDFTIARISTAPLPVNSAEDYQNMIDRAVGARSDTIIINLEVTEKVHPIEKK
ncbi:hypothetical protein EWM64_g9539 [Hericium alpestre]|uniref:Uncharacterized protein n=1 Tax=Hericium alpestre TaxID=135208 RepID=A0A4Y9ZJ42_9AGAM|nr:hypothetical protein EWM64_g9539 [Hericium alpestre]